jgi:hypothetical protein
MPIGKGPAGKKVPLCKREIPLVYGTLFLNELAAAIIAGLKGQRSSETKGSVSPSRTSH